MLCRGAGLMTRLFSAAGITHRLLEVRFQKIAPLGLLMKLVTPVLVGPKIGVGRRRPGEEYREAVRVLVGRPGKVRADDQLAVPRRQRAGHVVAGVRHGPEYFLRLF